MPSPGRSLDLFSEGDTLKDLAAVGWVEGRSCQQEELLRARRAGCHLPAPASPGSLWFIGRGNRCGVGSLLGTGN